MTFEQLKQECINRQRKLEIFQFLHFYIKAESYADLINLMKQSPDFSWHFNKAVLSCDFFREIPEDVRETNKIYDRLITLEDINSTSIYLLDGAVLNLTQSAQNRCKVVSFGGISHIMTKDQSMVEVENYIGATCYPQANNDSYMYITNRQTSITVAKGFDNSTTKIINLHSSISTVVLDETAFLNANLDDNSQLNYSATINTAIRTHAKSTATELPT